MSHPGLRHVTKAQLHGGASIFSSFKFHWWDLTLDCGDVVERRIRWLPPADGSPPERGWGALWHSVSLTRLPEPPKRAYCQNER